MCSKAFLIPNKFEFSEINDKNTALSKTNADSSHLEKEKHAMWPIC